MSNDIPPYWLPKYTEFWVVFDCSNGDYATKRNCWWFDTLKDAKEHIKYVRKLKNGVRLSKPTKVEVKS